MGSEWQVHCLAETGEPVGSKDAAGDAQQIFLTALGSGTCTDPL